MRRAFAAALLAAAAAADAAPGAGSDAAAAPQIDEPRAYGHVVGDLLTRRVRLVLPSGARLDAQALPRPGRIDTWLDLHSVALDAGAGGAVTLRLDYQVINVGPELVTTVLPALSLPLAGPAAGAIELPDWPVQLSPLIAAHAVARGALLDMQPDIAPVREPLAPLLLRLAATAAVLLALAAPGLARRWPRLAFWRAGAPFGRAWRELEAMRGDDAAPDATPRALARLHAAFDAAAGRAVFAPQLDALYAAQPALRQAAAEIEGFYAASREVHFAQGDGTLWPPARVRALARRLAQIEVRA